MALPLQLERYFFPVQKVEANPTHDPNLPIDSKSKLDVNVGEVEEQAGAYAVELTLSSSADSVNESYTYTIMAFALLRATDNTIPASELSAAAASFGASILVGVARERLAELTSRGPWPTVILNAVPLNILPPQQTDIPKKTSKENPEKKGSKKPAPKLTKSK